MSAAAVTMIRFLCLLGFALTVSGPGNGRAAEQERRLLFFGDVMLSREVAREIDRRGGVSPWSFMEEAGEKQGKADFSMINFEGAVDDPADAGEGCREAKGPCFAVPHTALSFLKPAHMTAAGLANNHTADLGDAGRARTKKALAEAGVDPLDFDDSPGFVRIGERSIAIVVLSLIPGRDGKADAVPSFEAERKMRLARTLADWVVVSVHWGVELRDWPHKTQYRAAEWLVGQGADLIIGHHPHVVSLPECVQGRPVFYSLGNHVFDQKYPRSKEGLIADCRVIERDGGMLSCSGLETRTPTGSSFPRLAGPSYGARAALERCTVPARGGLSVNGRRLSPWTEPGRLKGDAMVIEGRARGQKPWRVAGRKILSAEAGALEAGKPPVLFTVERHFSPIDKENSPRPYVYAVEDRGLAARWRGTALAWPLIDARLMPEEEDSSTMLVCALHRSDSFLQMDPDAEGTRTAVYRWNGFGFSGEQDEDSEARCRDMYRESAR